MPDVPPGLDIDNAPELFAPPCEWFALCGYAANGTVEHPVLGPVPCCDRCRDFAGETFIEDRT